MQIIVSGGQKSKSPQKVAVWASDQRDVPGTGVNLHDIVRGEFAENVHRQDFLPSEMVAILRALGPVEQAAAKARQTAGINQHTEPSEKFSQRLQGPRCGQSCRLRRCLAPDAAKGRGHRRRRRGRAGAVRQAARRYGPHRARQRPVQARVHQKY
jgi:hypothetical protein